MTGALCSFYPIKQSIHRNNILSLAGLVAIGVAMLEYDESLPFPSLYALLPVLGTCAVLLFSQQGTLVRSLLSHRYVSGIGLISYSAYLWHQPLFAFARIRSLTEPTWQLMLMLASASFALAYLSWRFVEVPARTRGDQPFWSRCTAFATLVIAAATFATFGIAGHLTSGFPSRLQHGEDTNLSFLLTAKPSPKRDQCHKHPGDDLTPSSVCHYFEGRLKIATFGDSHTVELAYALAQQLRQIGVSLEQFSFSGCIPSFGRTLEGRLYDCSKWTSNSLHFIADWPAAGSVDRYLS